MSTNERTFKNTIRSACKILKRKRNNFGQNKPMDVEEIVESFMNTPTANSMSEQQREVAIKWIKEAILN